MPTKNSTQTASEKLPTTTIEHTEAFEDLVFIVKEFELDEIKQILYDHLEAWITHPDSDYEDVKDRSHHMFVHRNLNKALTGLYEVFKNFKMKGTID